MSYSLFGESFSGYSGITLLMDDLNEGLQQDDVIMLGGGNPAPIPEIQNLLHERLQQMLQQGSLLQAISFYDGPRGNDAFIEVLVDFFQRHYGWKINTRNVTLTHGSQGGFFTLFNSLAGRMRDGSFQHVLLPLVPEYIGYSDIGVERHLFKSQPARVAELDARRFKYGIDFEQLEIDAKTGLVCVSRPTNPTGNVLTDAECQQLSQRCEAAGVPLLIDNAYGTPFPNILFQQAEPFWNDNTIVCMSLSKLGLPGVRTGIVVAAEELIDLLNNFNAVQSLSPGGVGPALMAPVVASDAILQWSQELIQPYYLQRSRFAMHHLLERIDDPRLKVHVSEGAMFLWLYFEDLPITSKQLYQRLKQRGLLVVPGEYFFPGLDPEHPWPHRSRCIRMNYVQSEDKLLRAIDILAETLKQIW